MISRNISSETAFHDTILFKSSERVNSPIVSLSLSEDLGIPEETFINYNIVSDNIFVETQTHYYFIPYVLNGDRISIKDRYDVVASIDLSPYDFSSILYVERERSYYAFLSRGDGQQLFFKVYKYRLGDNFVTEVYDSTQENGTTHENFIHNTTNIDWSTFHYTFSHNQKLGTFLVTYTLKNDDGYPMVYEHRFKVFQNKVVDESIRSNVYVITEPINPQKEPLSISFTMNHNTQDFCENGGSLYVGKFSFNEEIDNPIVYFVSYNEDGTEYYSDSDSLTKNDDGSYSWYTSSAWEINDENVHILQFFITSLTDASVQSGGASSVYFINNKNIVGVSTNTNITREYFGQTSDKYYVLLQDNAYASFVSGKTLDITKYCHFDSSWTSQEKPKKELNGERYICNNSITYSWELKMVSSDVIGCVSPESLPITNSSSFKYPEVLSTEIVIKNASYQFFQDYYTVRFNFLNDGEQISNDVVQIDVQGVYVTNIDNNTNTVTCLYSQKRGEKMHMDYQLNDTINGVITEKNSIDLDFIMRPASSNLSITPVFDDSNLDTYKVMISEDTLINGGYFSFVETKDPEPFMPNPNGKIYVKFGERVYDVNVTDAGNDDYTIQFTQPLEVKYGEYYPCSVFFETSNGSFDDKTSISISNNISVETTEIPYTFSFEKDNDSSIYGKISDPIWTSIVQPVRYTKNVSFPY